jgi:hypothetical protein
VQKQWVDGSEGQKGLKEGVTSGIVGGGVMWKTECIVKAGEDCE